MPTSKHRISISLADDEYTELSDVAAGSRVSMAWLARQALIEFLKRQRENRAQTPIPVQTLERAGR
jgi:predicted transcriptional regulator